MMALKLKYNLIIGILIVSVTATSQPNLLIDNKTNSEDLSKEEYISLCEGDFELASTVKSKLKCYYSSRPHHFLRYAPIKTEQVLLKPNIVLFHDIISHREIQHIKAAAAPKLERAVIQGEVAGKIETQYSKTRTNKIAWVNINHSNIVRRFMQRISDVTGLRVGQYPIQVARYDKGEYYFTHHDYFTPHGLKLANSKKGNRLASLVVYMSEVSGGATVFPHSRLTVFPIKGSALYWTNLLPSGQGDPTTLHAACPVKRGVKWVSVIWKHEIDDLKKQCSTQEI